MTIFFSLKINKIFKIYLILKELEKQLANLKISLEKKQISCRNFPEYNRLRLQIWRVKKNMRVGEAPASQKNLPLIENTLTPNKKTTVAIYGFSRAFYYRHEYE
jgi:hypothetical protein